MHHWWHCQQLLKISIHVACEVGSFHESLVECPLLWLFLITQDPQVVTVHGETCPHGVLEELAECEKELAVPLELVLLLGVLLVPAFLVIFLGLFFFVTFLSWRLFLICFFFGLLWLFLLTEKHDWLGADQLVRPVLL